MKGSLLASRYARALISSLPEGSRTAELVAELGAVATGLGSEKLSWTLLASGALPKVAVQKTIEVVLVGASQEIRNFVSFLVSRDRLPLLPQIEQAARAELDRKQGIARGTVESASDLDSVFVSSLEEKMGSYLSGRRATLRQIRNPNLIGGLKVSIAGLTFDDSLSGHLGRLTHFLKRSAV